MTLSKAQKWFSLALAGIGLVSGGVAFIRTALGTDQIRDDIHEIKSILNKNTEKLTRADERLNYIYGFLKFPLNQQENNDLDQGKLHEKNNRYYVEHGYYRTNSVQ